jgi:FHA domain
MAAERRGYASDHRDTEATGAWTTAHGDVDTPSASSHDAASQCGLPAGVQAVLAVIHGPSVGARFALDQDCTTAGRHPSSDILLDDITVSRRHAEIHCLDHGYRIVDVGSTNGTYVNRRLVDSYVLAPGDQIQIGKFSMQFVTSRPD